MSPEPYDSSVIERPCAYCGRYWHEEQMKREKYSGNKKGYIWVCPVCWQADDSLIEFKGKADER